MVFNFLNDKIKHLPMALLEYKRKKEGTNKISLTLAD